MEWSHKTDKLAKEIVDRYAKSPDYYGTTEFTEDKDENGNNTHAAIFFLLENEDLDDVWEAWQRDNPDIERERPDAEEFNDAIMDILSDSDDCDEIIIIDPSMRSMFRG